jgi:DNA integrity scanning protein DisA with diadenylate cyclase activity
MRKMSSYSDSNVSHKAIRSDAELAPMVVRVAEAAQADVIICATETGKFAQHLHGLSDELRIIAATTNRETYETLAQAGLETVRLPLRAADKYSQVRHIISVALRSTKVSIGDLVVCAIGRDIYPEEGNLIVLTDVESSIENLAVSDLLKLTDGIRPRVLEAAVTVACKIGQAARRGKRLGAIFMLGDSLKVMEDSKQLIPNPFQGHDEATRRLTNPDIHDALVELSKLDGAFVVRGDGFIQAAGVFLASTPFEIELPAGLGTRHTTAAAVTRRTAATAVVVSATDGNVRVFSEGRLVLHIDPDVAHGPIAIDD